MKKIIISIFLLWFFGCKEPNKSKENMLQEIKQLAPPPLPINEQRICDSLRLFAYSEISKERILIVFHDTITDKTLYDQFVSILKNRLGFNYFRLYDINNIESLPYKICVQPIMDSVIIARYGLNAKDSIINDAYRLTKSLTKKGNLK